jgi:hypothetical protein
VEKNASKKVDALRARRPPYFWAIGPAGRSSAFALTFPTSELVAFEPAPLEALRFQPKENP